MSDSLSIAPRGRRRPAAPGSAGGAQRLRCGLIAALTAALHHLPTDRRRPRGGAGRRWRIVLGGRRPQLDAWHGRGQRAENATTHSPSPACMRTLDELPKPTIARVHGAAFGGGVGLVRLLRHRHRHARREVRTDRKQARPAACGHFALRDRRDRRAPGAALVRDRGNLRRRRGTAHRPAAPGRGDRGLEPPCSARSTCCCKAGPGRGRDREGPGASRRGRRRWRRPSTRPTPN